ncbi:hypothetical protein [Mediterraneibacter sp. NSJ-151]|nr:hypothetical protein [Mediterraneibacter sp. NSJ-151]
MAFSIYTDIRKLQDNVDICKIYKSGVTDSVLDSYRCYLKQ